MNVMFVRLMTLERFGIVFLEESYFDQYGYGKLYIVLYLLVVHGKK
jgi:hypothetical protein